MSLYVVISPDCPHWPKGTFVEEDEYGEVQAVEVDTLNGRAIPGGFMGLVLPLHSVRKYLLRIQKRGLDKSW